MKRFIERLKELMKDHNIDVSDLSKILQLPFDTPIYSWLNGEYYPTLDRLIAMANYFQCSLEYLLGRTENNSIEIFNTYPSFNDRFEEILKQKKKKKYHLIKEKICSSDTFFKWKKFNRDPRIETVIKLADYFDVSIDYMVGRE